MASSPLKDHRGGEGDLRLRRRKQKTQREAERPALKTGHPYRVCLGLSGIALVRPGSRSSLSAWAYKSGANPNTVKSLWVGRAGISEPKRGAREVGDQQRNPVRRR